MGSRIWSFHWKLQAQGFDDLKELWGQAFDDHPELWNKGCDYCTEQFDDQSASCNFHCTYPPERIMPKIAPLLIIKLQFSNLYTRKRTRKLEIQCGPCTAENEIYQNGDPCAQPATNRIPRERERENCSWKLRIVHSRFFCNTHMHHRACRHTVNMQKLVQKVENKKGRSTSNKD